MPNGKVAEELSPVADVYRVNISHSPKKWKPVLSLSPLRSLLVPPRSTVAQGDTADMENHAISDDIDVWSDLE
jgi:hypothetical protein